MERVRVLVVCFSILSLARLVFCVCDHALGKCGFRMSNGEATRLQIDSWTGSVTIEKTAML